MWIRYSRKSSIEMRTNPKPGCSQERATVSGFNRKGSLMDQNTPPALSLTCIGLLEERI